MKEYNINPLAKIVKEKLVDNEEYSAGIDADSRGVCPNPLEITILKDMRINSGFIETLNNNVREQCRKEGKLL